MLPLLSESALVKSAIGHLQTVLNAEPEKLAMGLVSLAWLRLPGDEAAAVERACDFANGHCLHGWISRCEDEGCRAEVQATYASWNADAESDRAQDEELERER